MARTMTIRLTSGRAKISPQLWTYRLSSKKTEISTHSNPPLPLVSCSSLRAHPPPPPTTDGRDGAHWYVPRRGLWGKNRAIWRGAGRLGRIMTGNRRKNQGFGRETKTRATHIAYNPVARFYIIFFQNAVFVIYSDSF